LYQAALDNGGNRETRKYVRKINTRLCLLGFSVSIVSPRGVSLLELGRTKAIAVVTTPPGSGSIGVLDVDQIQKRSK